MHAKNLAKQGTAVYQGETVDIIDVIGDSNTGKIEYMINYNGPTWVIKEELDNIVWSI